MHVRAKREVELRTEALREDIRRANLALSEIDLHPRLPLRDERIIRPIKILGEALRAAYKDHFLESSIEPKALTTKLEIERVLSENPYPGSINTNTVRTALEELDRALREQVALKM